MIYFLEFVSEALEEAEEATRYYQDIQLGLGVRFREEVEAILKPSWLKSATSGEVA